MKLIENYKQALKCMGKSICLISSFDEKGRYVSPSSAVTNFSYDPPTFLLPLEKSASLYGPLVNEEPFAINVLGVQHKALLDTCLSQKGEERFSTGNWVVHPNGLTVLADAQANFICQCKLIDEYHGHALFMGHVVEASSAEDLNPLIYIDGGLVEIQSDSVTSIV